MFHVLVVFFTSNLPFDICRDKDDTTKCQFHKRTTEIIQMNGNEISFKQVATSLQNPITIDVPDTEVRHTFPLLYVETSVNGNMFNVWHLGDVSMTL